MNKKSKIIKVIIIVAIIAISFTIGLDVGKKSNELIDPLNIDQWNVKTFSVNGKIIYESDGKKYITDDKEEGWNALLREINIVCKPRKSTEGSTAHTNYKIEMKNGDVYYIEWLGCMDQVDITYPDGTTKKYYGYYR